MFEFEPDAYIFTKFANYFKKRKNKKLEEMAHAVNLVEIKQKLTIIARALTGNTIEIFEAENEGGYRNHNFFLPKRIAIFPSAERNISFYLFRLLYLTIQQEQDLNWNDQVEHSLDESRAKARETAKKVLSILFEHYPITKAHHSFFIDYYTSNLKENQAIDYTMLYGKWMKNSPENQEATPLTNFSDKAKSSKEDDPSTILKTNAVEEIISVQVDLKQQEDAVLQHQFEKVETAEEFGGNFRDFDGDDDLDEHSNALDEINMKYTVRVDDTAHSVYQAEFMENTTVHESIEKNSDAYHLDYDEWNYKKRSYMDAFCKVYPKNLTEKDEHFYKKTIDGHRSTLLGLRKMLSNINNKYEQRRRQLEGDEFDLDALIDLYTDVRTRHTPTEKIYLSKRKKEKDLSILLLLDVSLSSDGYSAGNKVIDVEKEVSILFGEILNEYHIDFSIDAFYSKTRNYSSYITIKGFDEPWNIAKYKVGAIKPSGYTRIGSALRHSGALLDKRPTKNKWVILISDGKPNDYDKYEGKHGINDVKQALRELNSRGIHSYGLAIEAQAKYYLPQMFGQNHYQILTNPVELLNALVKLYEKIKHQS